LFCAAFLSGSAAFVTRAESGRPDGNEAGNLADAADPLPLKITVIDGQDIRFRRLSGGAGLSQTRVAWAVQDNLGFIWLGTQYGLNRYDGYKSKVFRHQPGRSDSLSCVYIRSLFVDHAGTLWIGCDRSLDKFEPASETFAHYRIDTQVPGRLPTPIERITEDAAGILWLATARGLYKLDPATGQTTRYAHDPADPASIAGNRINFVGEDRTGRFWVANSGGLEEFDRKTGTVTRHVTLPSEVAQFHEDKFGVFWTRGHESTCALGTLNRKTNVVTCHSIAYKRGGVTTPVRISGMLETQDGTVWLGSMGAGLLKVDREHRRIISYHNQPSDSESLGSNSVINVFQDKEGNIWTCFQ